MRDIGKLIIEGRFFALRTLPMVETIMDKESMMQGTYEKARIAMVAKRSGVLCTIQHLAKT